MITLRSLLSQSLPDIDTAKISDIPVYGVECDSRKVQKGFIFVAIPGVKKDGSLFIQEAIERGASVVVSEKEETGLDAVPFVRVKKSREAAASLVSHFFGEPSKQMKMIGITGTNGKTTCSYLLEHMLTSFQKKTGVFGTISYRFANKEVPAVETTPGPITIQSLLSQMKDAGCEYVAMEVSSHALDQGRTQEIDFEAALFTNLTQDHLDYHKTMEAYFECKARLFTSLGADKKAVINSDDAWGKKLISKTKAKVFTYGFSSEAQFKAKDIQFLSHETAFTLEYPGGQCQISYPMLGEHNLYNVLGSLATISALGFDVKSAGESLKNFKGVPGRLEVVSEGQNFLVFVDFAHTPDGLENVLRSLLPYKKRKLSVVFGCGGDRDKDKRPKMGKIASTLSDFVFVTSDNPRSEEPSSIAAQIVAGFPEGFKNYSTILDRTKAIRQALMNAREGDIVVLAGKGHESTQVLKDKTIPFSDRKEAERILGGK